MFREYSNASQIATESYETSLNIYLKYTYNKTRILYTCIKFVR